jgi:hypothetical protein
VDGEPTSDATETHASITTQESTMVNGTDRKGTPISSTGTTIATCLIRAFADERSGLGRA